MARRAPGLRVLASSSERDRRRRVRWPSAAVGRPQPCSSSCSCLAIVLGDGRPRRHGSPALPGGLDRRRRRCRGGVGPLPWSLNTHQTHLQVPAACSPISCNAWPLTSTRRWSFTCCSTLPDGRLTRPATPTSWSSATVTAVASGWRCWPTATKCTSGRRGAVGGRRRSPRSGGACTTTASAGAVDRRRMQWLGWAPRRRLPRSPWSCIALSLVTDWPHHDAEIALAASGLVPLPIAAGTIPRLLARVDRLLTHTVSLAGLTAS